MINVDEDALLCDLAETYHIFNIDGLPLSQVARFSVGLRENSRIKMKMANVKYEFKDILLAGIIDRLSILTWQNTEDAQKGKNKPKSLINLLLDIEINNKKDSEVSSFASPQEFEKARNEILQKGE